ncbi:MAG TPA: TolC family protein [Longimicrobium sp.]|jgi:outer membrane protein TolC
MKKRMRIAAAVAASLVAVSTSRAQDPLGGYVREGLRANLGLAQQRLEAGRAEAAVRQARGMYLPSVTVDSRYSQTAGGMNIGDLVNPAYAALNQLLQTNQFPTNVNARLPYAQETRVRVTQPVFQPAVRENHRIQRSLRDAARQGTQASARQLAADVQTAYLNYARAERVVELYRNTLPLLAENLRVSESLLRNGRATSEIVYRARAEQKETEQRLAEAEQLRDAARRYFNFLLDRADDTAIEPVADSLLAFPLAVTVDEALARARAGREELAQAGHAIQAAEAQRGLARAAYLPGVSLALDYGFQGDRYQFDANHDFAVASLVFSWNVFNGGQDAARRQIATLATQQARTGRTEAERRIEMQVRQAYQAAVVARGAIETADARLAAARRTFELVTRRWQEGIAPQIELVDARTAFTNAQLNRILTGYEYAQRYVELERAAALRELGDVVDAEGKP